MVLKWLLHVQAVLEIWLGHDIQAESVQFIKLAVWCSLSLLKEHLGW